MEERFKTDPGKLSPGAEADTRWSKVQGSSCSPQGRESLQRQEGKGMRWGEIRWPVTQQCSSAVGTASAAGPGGKEAQRKSAGTAAPARTLGRWAGHGSDSPLIESTQDFIRVEAVGASAGQLLQRVRMGCPCLGHGEKSIGDCYVTSEYRTSHHANHYKTGIGQFRRKFQNILCAS